MYNLKESAKTLLFLKERGLDNYDLLVEKTAAAQNAFGKDGNRRTKISDRLKEITELQKHISVYIRTKDVYARYRDSKFNKDFYEAHRADLTLRKAAKNHFDSLGLQKLPTIEMLKKEYVMLSAEQKKINSGHKENREEMLALLMAKQNVDRILFGTPTQIKNLERGAR